MPFFGGWMFVFYLLSHAAGYSLVVAQCPCWTVQFSSGKVQYWRNSSLLWVFSSMFKRFSPSRSMHVCTVCSSENIYFCLKVGVVCGLHHVATDISGWFFFSETSAKILPGNGSLEKGREHVEILVHVLQGCWTFQSTLLTDKILKKVMFCSRLACKVQADHACRVLPCARECLHNFFLIPSVSTPCVLCLVMQGSDWQKLCMCFVGFTSVPDLHVSVCPQLGSTTPASYFNPSDHSPCRPVLFRWLGLRPVEYVQRQFVHRSSWADAITLHQAARAETVCVDALLQHLGCDATSLAVKI